MALYVFKCRDKSSVDESSPTEMIMGRDGVGYLSKMNQSDQCIVSRAYLNDHMQVIEDITKADDGKGKQVNSCTATVIRSLPGTRTSVKLFKTVFLLSD